MYAMFIDQKLSAMKVALSVICRCKCRTERILADFLQKLTKLIQGKARKGRRLTIFKTKKRNTKVRGSTPPDCQDINFKLQKSELCATWLKNTYMDQGTDWNPEIDL